MKNECLVCGSPLVYFETEKEMECVFCHKKEEIADDYNAIKKKAKEIYKKDRKAILNNAKLRIDRRVFCILSYISIGFVKMYGVLLKKIVRSRKR